MSLEYGGSLTLSQILPGLDDAVGKLEENLTQVEEFLTSRQRNLSGLSNRIENLQEEYNRLNDVFDSSQAVLEAANAALEEAKNLASEVTDALAIPGVSLYYYGGNVGNFASEVNNKLGGGIPSSEGGNESPTQSVAATIVLAAGPDTETITKVFNQIGGVGQDIVDMFD